MAIDVACFGAVGQGFHGGLSAAKPVPLSKVTLEKRGDKVSLDKRAGQGFGRIHVNLNWNQNASAGPCAPSKSSAPTLADTSSIADQVKRFALGRPAVDPFDQ
jgi:hypothetical protein